MFNKMRVAFCLIVCLAVSGMILTSATLTSALAKDGKSLKKAIEMQKAIDLLKKGEVEYAASLFKLAFQEGTADAGFYLARLQESGALGPISSDDFKSLYIKAAEQGSSKALNRVGVMHYKGEFGLLQNFDKAETYLCEAARLNDREGLANCGLLLLDKRYKKRDVKAAKDMLEKAVQAGSVNAHYNLAEQYNLGDNFQRNRKLAMQYYESAASFGHGGALMALAQIYFEGKPVSRNLKKAYLYARLAEKKGVVFKPDFVRLVLSNITPEEREAVEQRDFQYWTEKKSLFY